MSASDMPPPPPNPTPYGAAAASAGTSGKATASLILGILGVTIGLLLPFGTIVLSVLAIVFGVLGRNEARRKGQRGFGLATAGLVLGIVGIVLLFVAIGIIVSND